MNACAFQHVALPPGERPRCIWWDRGAGTVVARVELLGMVTGYDVELDDSDGPAERALPAQLRLVPAEPPACEPKALRFSHIDEDGMAVYVGEKEPLWSIPPAPLGFDAGTAR